MWLETLPRESLEREFLGLHAALKLDASARAAKACSRSSRASGPGGRVRPPEGGMSWVVAGSTRRTRAAGRAGGRCCMILRRIARYGRRDSKVLTGRALGLNAASGNARCASASGGPMRGDRRAQHSPRHVSRHAARVLSLWRRPDMLLVDGNDCPNSEASGALEARAIVRATPPRRDKRRLDSGKTARDQFMNQMHAIYLNMISHATRVTHALHCGGAAHGPCPCIGVVCPVGMA